MIATKENIGIIVRCLKDGGAERAVANLSRDLSDNYNIFLFLYNDFDDIAYPYSGEIVNLHFMKRSNPVAKLSELARRLHEIKKQKLQHGIKVMISFMPDANTYNILTCGSGKSIISIRNTMSMKKLSKTERKFLVKNGKKAYMTVSLSEGAREDMIKNFGCDPKKIITIYNSCDPKWFHQENDEIKQLCENYDFSVPTLVTTGRLHPQKGQWHLLRALSIVKKQIPNCKLVIFGQGELEDGLKQYAQKLGVYDSIDFMGYVKGHHKFMEKCDMFVFPSIFEGLGNVLLEAIACGMPVVSADCKCGPREILSKTQDTTAKAIDYSDYGVLIPPFSTKPFDPEDMTFEKSDELMAEAIIKLLQDQKLKKQYAERAKGRSRDFLPEQIKQQWINLIEDALHDKKDNK